PYLQLACLLDWLRRRCIGKPPRGAPRASKRLQLVSVVSQLVVNQCCARRGNGAMAGGCVPARRKAYTCTWAQAANPSLRPTRVSMMTDEIRGLYRTV